MELVSLALKSNHVAWRSPRRNRDLQVRPLFYNSSSLTCLTLSSCSKNVPHTITMLAILLNLSVHARSNLSHFSNSALSPTIRALSYIRSSFALTNITYSSSLMEHWNIASFIQLLQSNIKSFFSGLHLGLLFVLFTSSLHNLHEI